MGEIPAGYLSAFPSCSETFQLLCFPFPSPVFSPLPYILLFPLLSLCFWYYVRFAPLFSPLSSPIYSLSTCLIPGICSVKRKFIRKSGGIATDTTAMCVCVVDWTLEWMDAALWDTPSANGQTWKPHSASSPLLLYFNITQAGHMLRSLQGINGFT